MDRREGSDMCSKEEEEDEEVTSTNKENNDDVNPNDYEPPIY
jgi:hypothetical protein